MLEGPSSVLEDSNTEVRKRNKNILRMQGEPQKGKDHKHRGYDPHGARNMEEISQQGIKEEKKTTSSKHQVPHPRSNRKESQLCQGKGLKPRAKRLKESEQETVNVAEGREQSIQW